VTRVALLDHRDEYYAAELAGALRRVGVETTAIGPSAAARAAERLLARRGFAYGVAHVAPVTARLLSGDCEIAHALSPPDAVAALGWRRVTRRPVVFTCTEILDRTVVSHGRLRLHMLERATQDADAVLAADAEVAASMERWLAIDAAVLDASGYARLYGELLALRG
jgi:hypothetical protein